MFYTFNFIVLNKVFKKYFHKYSEITFFKLVTNFQNNYMSKYNINIKKKL